MHKLYTFFSTIVISFFLVSFSTNPPDGNTGAPGEQLCIQCHMHTNPQQNGTITIDGFPESITPNETYFLKVTNRLTTGTAVRTGFQVTVLGPFNTRAGTFSNPSTSSIVSVSNNRQYWDHDPAKLIPDSNVVSWTVEWTAPELAAGSQITWYAAGNFADGNFQNIGDRIVTANGSGSVVIAATDDLSFAQPVIYPNPGNEEITIQYKNNLQLDGHVSFYDLSGKRVADRPMESGVVNIPALDSGIYLLHIISDDHSHFMRWSRI